MNLLITVIYVYAILIIAFSFINLKLSISLYTSYLILVPYLEFKIASLSLSYNLVNTLLFGVFLLNNLLSNKKQKLSFKLISPFLYLYVSFFFLSFFAWSTSWEIQFNYWRISFMAACFVPFIVWNITLTDPKIFTYLKWALIISISISGTYALFLTKMEGLNPYTSFLAAYFNQTDAADIYSSNNSARLSFSSAEKVQSTTIHPMTWTLLLCFFITIFTSYYLKTKNYIYLFFISFIAFNILISGVRTGIVSIIIGYIYFLIRLKKIKLIVWALVFISLFSVVVQSNEDLSNLFASFTDITGENNNIKGSSISMRLNQFDGAVNEVKGVELVGKGFGWNNYYQSINGDHPILLAFESIIFILICNTGFIGILIWAFFFVLLFKLQRNILKKMPDVFLMDSFLIIYILYTIGTGDYGYTQIFSFYYTYLLAFLFNNQRLLVTNQYITT